MNKKPIGSIKSRLRAFTMTSETVSENQERECND